jgi:hypothetical protein
MYPFNPRGEQRHYPTILQRLKHTGVMETSENVVDEHGGDEALGTPLGQCETWVPLGPHRPGSRPSPTSGFGLLEDPPTCQWAQPT